MRITDITFIAARLDEDETIAHEASHGSGTWTDNVCEVTEDHDSNAVLEMRAFSEPITHAARHDPDRVLREVAALRAMLAAHPNESTLRALASIWSDHADYTPDWRCEPCTRRRRDDSHRSGQWTRSMSLNLEDLDLNATAPPKPAPNRPYGMAAWKTAPKRMRAKTILYVTSPLLDDETIRDALHRGYVTGLPVHVALVNGVLDRAEPLDREHLTRCLLTVDALIALSNDWSLARSREQREAAKRADDSGVVALTSRRRRSGRTAPDSDPPWLR